MLSSVGRAAPLQGVGREFETLSIHQGVVVQLVRIPACHAGGRGFESRPLRQDSLSLGLSSEAFYFQRPFGHSKILFLITLSERAIQTIIQVFIASSGNIDHNDVVFSKLSLFQDGKRVGRFKSGNDALFARQHECGL